MRTDDRVAGNADGIPFAGTLLGLATECGVRQWIVLLDRPIYKYAPSSLADDDDRVVLRAIVMPESLLSELAKEEL